MTLPDGKLGGGAEAGAGTVSTMESTAWLELMGLMWSRKQG